MSTKSPWEDQPNYNPHRLFNKLKERRSLVYESEFAKLLGLHNSDISRIRCNKRPIGASLILRILYEFPDLNVMDVFTMMGVDNPYEDK